MKILLILLAGALGCLAQPALTSIADTMYNADGSTFTGQLTIQSQTFASTGNTILQNVKSLRITNGVLNVSLAPNDTSSPAGTSYLFSFGTGAQLTCTIPTSSAPIKLQGNCVAGPPAPAPGQVMISQLVAGASPGAYCLLVDSSGGITLSASGCPGTGGSGLSWSGLTSPEWSGLSSSDWANLVH